MMIGLATGAIWGVVFVVKIDHQALIAAAIYGTIAVPISAGVLWGLKWLKRTLA